MTAESVQEGDKVAVIYTGKLEDGTVFDTNVSDEPLEFTVGNKEVISGFEKAVEGLSVGEKNTVTVGPAEAYGERDNELVIPVKREIFGDAEPEPGMEVALRGQDGTVFNGQVNNVEDETVQVDLNHPLAGKKLVFEVEVRDRTPSS